MPPDPKYTDQQRSAVTSAVIDQGMDHKRALALAAQGALRDENGGPIAPFQMAAGYVPTLVSRERRRRSGKAKSELAKAEPRDAIETLRIRLLNLTDSEMRAVERKRGGTRDLVKIQQLTKLVQQVASLPGPNDARPVAPGVVVDGRRPSGERPRTAQAAAILADVRGSAPDDQEPPAALAAVPDPPKDGGGGMAADEPASDPGDVVRAMAERQGIPLTVEARDGAGFGPTDGAG